LGCRFASIGLIDAVLHFDILVETILRVNIGLLKRSSDAAQVGEVLLLFYLLRHFDQNTKRK
jgi:hypothetical protein